VRAFCARSLRFLCPHAKDTALTARLAALEEETLRPLAYAAERHRKGPPRYRASECRLPVAGRELRALFVLSLDQAAARQQRRGVPRGQRDWWAD
jgi:hypothetical protein